MLSEPVLQLILHAVLRLSIVAHAGSKRALASEVTLHYLRGTWRGRLINAKAFT